MNLCEKPEIGTKKMKSKDGPSPIPPCSVPSPFAVISRASQPPTPTPQSFFVVSSNPIRRVQFAAGSPPEGDLLLLASGRLARSFSRTGRLLLLLLLLGLVFGVGGALDVLGAGLAVQKAALLDGATSLHARVVLVVVVGVQHAADAVGPADGAREVRDVLRDGVLAADGARVDTVALAGLVHGIVAAVKVLALLEVLGEVVAAAGQLAIQPEEPLLLGGEGLRG